MLLPPIQKVPEKLLLEAEEQKEEFIVCATFNKSRFQF
jgi:hypothetical protein